MAQLKTMYPAQANTPETTLARVADDYGDERYRPRRLRLAGRAELSHHRGGLRHGGNGAHDGKGRERPHYHAGPERDSGPRVGQGRYYRSILHGGRP